ncbi:lung adenoma susceptibility protein 2 isoform X2 [Anabas testudineus]|uniref:lung adenoma susceptibility protein 2 isoform X2 n=1 Tax=Anabas testudineus TaxID=64144 RepID=UPI000E465961|nr:lung adenoma susceptibility protein 2 isoform X2 [Anabas testudineus]
MDSSSLAGEFLSPESTVTSLLSSSGHLRSSLLPPENIGTFRYRDKSYDSASAALDAYIEDFDMTHQNSGSQTSRLVLPHSFPSTPRKVSALRNRDVLRESLTDRELDFLNLPVSSLCHRDNRDRLSMTTDELLSIPFDGSMPVTHTSAFIQGLTSHSRASQHCCCSSRPGHRACARLSSSHTTSQLNHHPCLIRTPRSSRCRGKPEAVTVKTLDDVPCCSHREVRSEWAKPSLSLHLPHWFTSNKADMDCSGMTSVPDLKYPAWIQHCGLSEPPPPQESELWDHAPRTRAPSWVAELEEDDQTLSQAGSQQSLKDLRLQFAQQISLLAAERKNSDVVETLFRDSTIESLIQKADHVLNSLSLSSGRADSPADSVSPVKTEDLLFALPSHCPPSSLNLAGAAEGATEALTDRGAQALGCSLRGSSIWTQPGPVEALKQMLFRLQAVEAELQRQQQASVTPTVTDRLQTEETPVKQEVSQRPDSEAELEGFPGGLSLQRALHHLSRLKLLVEEPGLKHKKKEEEKDEDEGHYSSSSADGLVCTQQRPS